MIVINKKKLTPIVIILGGIIILINLTFIFIISTVMDNNYKSIYNNDILDIKNSIIENNRINNELFTSLKTEYENLIEEKNDEILILNYEVMYLSNRIDNIHLNTEEDLNLIFEFKYALDLNRKHRLSLEDIKLIIQESKRYNFNDNMPHLVIALMELESNLNPTVVSRSNARGIAQFLSSTGKWVYEERLGYGKGTYNHNMAFENPIAIKMCLNYLDYIYDLHKGDMEKILMRYNGGDIGTRYYTIINNNIKKNTNNKLTIYSSYRNKSD